MVILCVFIFSFSIHLPKLMATTRIHLPKPTAFHSQTSDFTYFPFLYLSNYVVDNNKMVVLRSDKYFQY